MKMSIDGHNLTIVASDGQPTEPYQVRRQYSSYTDLDTQNSLMRTNQQ